MLKHYNGFTVINNREEFNNYWNDSLERLDHSLLRTNELYYIDKENKSQLTFPLYLKYCEPWDTHECGYYIESSKEEYIKAVQDTISYLRERLAELEKYEKELLDK